MLGKKNTYLRETKAKKKKKKWCTGLRGDQEKYDAMEVSVLVFFFSMFFLDF